MVPYWAFRNKAGAPVLSYTLLALNTDEVKFELWWISRNGTDLVSKKEVAGTKKPFVSNAYTLDMNEKAPPKAGRVRVRVIDKNDGKVHRDDKIVFRAALNTNTAGEVGVEQQGPRLVRAINESPLLKPEQRPDYDSSFDFANPQAKEIHYILKIIWERLTSDFSDVWQTAYALGGMTPPEESTLSHEERWARMTTEKLLGAPYNMPSNVYSGPFGGFGDGRVFWEMQESDHPGHPISLECQHLCDFAVISRGYRFTKMEAPEKRSLKSGFLVTAGPSKMAFDTLDPAASWHENATGSLQDVPAGFGAGAMYAFAPDTGGQGAGSHILFSLRVDREGGDGKVKRIQFFDTGTNACGALDDTEPVPTFPKLYDYRWTNSVGKTSAPRKGMGVLPADESRLAFGIARLRKLRPFGFARLAIVRNNPDGSERTEFKAEERDQWLVYATPLLRMWGANEEHNFPISRYLWSLRALPGSEHLQAVWLIDAPTGKFADRVFRASRSQTTTQMVEEFLGADAHKPAGRNKLQGRGLFAGFTPPSTRHVGLLDIASTQNGTVKGLGFISSKAGTGSSAEISRKHRKRFKLDLGWDQGKPTSDLAGEPAYFRDENP